MAKASLLGSPGFAKLWMAQVISRGGDTITEVALAVFVLRISHDSATAFGTIVFVGLLPGACLGWVPGGIIDRWNKRTVMVASDLLRALLVASLPIFPSLVWAAAVVFLVQFLGLFYLPAARAVMPETIPAPRILEAGAWLSAGQAVSQLLGYAVAAAVTLDFTITRAFELDAATFLVSGILVLGTRLPPEVWSGSTAIGEGFGQAMAEGVRYHRRHPQVLILLGLSGIAALACQGINVAAAMTVREVLHRPTAIFGVLMLLMQGGMLLGSMGVARRAPQWSYGKTVSGGFLVMGALTATLGFVSHLIPALGVYLFMGIANAAFLLPIRAWLQARVEVQYRGRVYAARGLVLGIAGAISSLGAGVLIGVIGVVGTLVLLGCILSAAGVLGWLLLDLGEVAAPPLHPSGPV